MPIPAASATTAVTITPVFPLLAGGTGGGW
jgi:hypothetical protein